MAAYTIRAGGTKWTGSLLIATLSLGFDSLTWSMFLTLETTVSLTTFSIPSFRFGNQVTHHISIGALLECYPVEVTNQIKINLLDKYTAAHSASTIFDLFVRFCQATVDSETRQTRDLNENNLSITNTIDDLRRIVLQNTFFNLVNLF